MAFLPTSEKDKEEEKAAGAQSSENVLSSASGAVGGGAGTAAPAASSSSANSSGGTGFVNLQSYLDANKEGASRMATGLAGAVQEKADTARGSVDTARSQFDEQAKQNRITGADEVMKKIKAGRAAEVDKDRFGRVTSGKYAGPTGLVGEDQAASAVQKARQARDLTGTSEGRHTLLRDVYGRPTYTKGESRLDQALVAADPTSRQQFKDVREKNMGLADYLDKARGYAAETAGKYQSEAEKAQQNVRGAVGLRATEFEQALQQKLADQNRQRQANYDQMTARLSPGNQKFSGLTGQGDRYADTLSQLEELGVSRDDIQKALKSSGYRYGNNLSGATSELGNIFGDVNLQTMEGLQNQATLNMKGINAADYLGRGADLNLAQVAQDRDRAELAALRGLGGEVGLDLSSSGAGADPYSFRRDDFLAAIKEAGRRMEDWHRVNDKNIPKDVLPSGLGGGGVPLPPMSTTSTPGDGGPAPVVTGPATVYRDPLVINSASY